MINKLVEATAMFSTLPSRSTLQEKTQRWVIKIGSSLLTSEDHQLDMVTIRHFVEQILHLRERGIEVVLVSSGSVSVGKGHLGLTEKTLPAEERQAAASVGQAALMHAYESLLAQAGVHCGQILLTQDNFKDRKRRKKTLSAINMLTKMKMLPILNENDALADTENQFGNNDHLAAVFCGLWHGDLMVLLTDQEGLYEADPRVQVDAQMIQEGMAGDPRYGQMAGGSGTAVGTGGMRTKVDAAAYAASSGTATVIASGHLSDVLLRLQNGERLGTFLRSKKFDQMWLKARRAALQKTTYSLLGVGTKLSATYSERSHLSYCYK
ncbi:glutamate 5-kinase [Acidithiobacillus sp.]|uniref:glutamate 5-kinase n=1 Tax=Acidithiobacillus sp. TaxID=1872118 RepID=UPI00262097AC|nr:glutamate 5-kinase [Acidithiobacillus sp.]MDD2748790.1 glutamate 5-kinase [Acidithiobacillus sp.]MDD5280307.1 glutamate 5-kinase [Acidithiobacillus sp.]